MYSLIDYLKYYNNTKLNEYKWNMLDNLLISTLTYLPFDSFTNSKTIKEIYNLNTTKNKPLGEMEKKSLEILKDLYKTKRYQSLVIEDFKNINSNEYQFGALTAKIGKEKIIAFKGSDSTIEAWIENIRLMYKFPTTTQSIALDYLDRHISYLDKDVTLIGHSKGGNLAMSSYMLTKNLNKSKIKTVINLDGPGFRLEEYVTSEYKDLSNKLINIVPERSMVGMILNNKCMKAIKTTKKGIDEHYITNWSCFGSFLIEGKLSKASIEAKEEINKLLNKLSLEDKEILVESLNKLFIKHNIKYIEDIKVETIIKLMNEITKLNKESKEIFINILKRLMK